MNLTSQLKMFAMTCLIAGNLAACVSDTTPASTATTTTTITGQAIAGAVDGTVTVRATDANGTQLATATVTKGSFSVTIDNAHFAKALDFEVTGSYRDEVSGATVDLTVANPLALRTAASHFTAGQTGNAPVTPGSSIVREMVQNQAMTLAQAQASFQNSFGYTPDLTAKPFDPYTVPTNTPTAADNNAAFRVGVFSQIGSDLGLSASDLAELPAKFAADLADGTFDGTSNINPVTFGSGVNLQTIHQTKPLGNRISMALAKFAGSAANRAGIAPPNMGLPPIVGYTPGTPKAVTLANNTLVNVSMGTTYSAPFQPGFKVAKTSHTIILTDASGLPYTAANSLMVMPKMYMNAGHQHGTPHAMTVDAGGGVYTVDMYYLMASGMNGMPMGQWELDVSIGDPTSTSMMDPYAHGYFYPNVGMNMGGILMNPVNDVYTVSIATDPYTYSTSNDTWTNMTGITNPREYRVWLHSITGGTGAHIVTVFVSTQNMANMPMGGGMAAMAHSPMTFPAVDAGVTLQGPLAGMTRPDKVVANVGVTIGGVNAAPLGGGRYQATLNTLTSNTVANIEIGLTVDTYAMTVGATNNNASLSFTAP